MTTDKKDETEKYNAPALSKGLDILELLAKQNSGMRKTEIANALNRTTSEIFRMLAVLVDREYVLVESSTERYSLSLKMFELGHLHPPVNRLSSVSADTMSKLANSLNQSVHLSVLHDTNILVIAQNNPPGNNITSVRLGARIPVTQTASGAVLVSQFSDARNTEICEQTESATAEQIVVFNEAVSQVKSTGICVTPSMVIVGVHNVSVPVRDYSGHIIASLTIPFIRRLTATNDPDLEAVKIAMIKAGNTISTLLGARVSP